MELASIEADKILADQVELDLRVKVGDGRACRRACVLGGGRVGVGGVRTWLASWCCTCRLPYLVHSLFVGVTRAKMYPDACRSRGGHPACWRVAPLFWAPHTERYR